MTFVLPLLMVPIYSVITFILNLKRLLGTESFYPFTQTKSLRYRDPGKIKKVALSTEGFSRGPHKGSLSEPKFVQSGLSLKYPEISFGWAVSNRDTVECWHEKLCWVKYSPSLKGFLQCCIIHSVLFISNLRN